MMGLDTNVLVRYIMQDDAKQSAQAVRLLDALSVDTIEEGSNRSGLKKLPPPFTPQLFYNGENKCQNSQFITASKVQVVD